MELSSMLKIPPNLYPLILFVARSTPLLQRGSPFQLLLSLRLFARDSFLMLVQQPLSHQVIIINRVRVGIIKDEGWHI